MRTGRPPKDPADRRVTDMKIPLSEQEKAAIQDAARSMGEKPVVWVREIALRAAKRVSREK